LARTVQDELRDRVNVKQFGAVGDGVTDDTAAIVAALASGAKSVYMPGGVYKITSQVSIPDRVSLYGDGYTNSGGVAGTRILKNGNFTGVVVNLASQLKDVSVEGDTGNGGDGVQLKGGRGVITNVTTSGHGRDGLKIGGYSSETTANTNLWRVNNVLSRSNARYGCFVSHEGKTTLPDANAGVLNGLEATLNGSDGLRIGEAFDNTYLGVACQTNTGYGIRLTQYAIGNAVMFPYLEANAGGTKQTVLDSGADRNYIYGFGESFTGTGVLNNGANNYILGRSSTVLNVPLMESPFAYLDLRVMEPTLSGSWSLTKVNPGRNLSIKLLGTSSNADVVLEGSGGLIGLRFSSATDAGSLQGIIRKTQAVNFGSIPANSTVDVAITITGADNSFAYSATPIFAIASGVIWSAYWDSVGLTVKARCANVTGGAISVSGNFIVVGTKIG
jgi:hypothetical protein